MRWRHRWYATRGSRESGSQLTPRWRKLDSNPRSRRRTELSFRLPAHGFASDSLLEESGFVLTVPPTSHAHARRREGPRVCRLAAGGNRIRTLGPTRPLVAAYNPTHSKRERLSQAMWQSTADIMPGGSEAQDVVDPLRPGRRHSNCPTAELTTLGY